MRVKNKDEFFFLIPGMPTLEQCYWHIVVSYCYELHCVPQKRYVEVLAPGISECDCIWK